jgi:Holliday junction resolvase RusA-like endonuclease
MNSLTITIPLPPSQLHPNSSCHYYTRTKKRREYRGRSNLCALSALRGQKPPMWKKATIKVMAYYMTNRYRDDDNLLASLKSAFDGLQDAGIIANDHGLRHESPESFKDAKNPRIELIITPEP